MSNQGWAPPPRNEKNKSAGEKVYDVVSWPFRKVFGFVVGRVFMKYGRNKR